MLVNFRVYIQIHLRLWRYCISVPYSCFSFVRHFLFLPQILRGDFSLLNFWVLFSLLNFRRLFSLLNFRRLFSLLNFRWLFSLLNFRWLFSLLEMGSRSVLVPSGWSLLVLSNQRPKILFKLLFRSLFVFQRFRLSFQSFLNLRFFSFFYNLFLLIPFLLLNFLFLLNLFLLLSLSLHFCLRIKNILLMKNSMRKFLKSHRLT